MDKAETGRGGYEFDPSLRGTKGKPPAPTEAPGAKEGPIPRHCYRSYGLNDFTCQKSYGHDGECGPRNSSEGQHPAQAIVGADARGPASPAHPGTKSTGENPDRSVPEPPARNGRDFSVTYDDLCELSRVFNRGGDLSKPQHVKINEWLKAAIGASAPMKPRPNLEGRWVTCDACPEPHRWTPFCAIAMLVPEDWPVG